MQLACDARNTNLQSHFVRMARAWFGMTISKPHANAGRDLAAGKARAT